MSPIIGWYRSKLGVHDFGKIVESESYLSNEFWGFLRLLKYKEALLMGYGVFFWVLCGGWWVMPNFMHLMLQGWRWKPISFRHRAWNLVPLCLIWILWRERNRRTFKGQRSRQLWGSNQLLWALYLIGYQ